MTAERIVHDAPTLVGRRGFGIALSYEDVVDHCDLRRDLVLGTVLMRVEVGRP